MQTLVKLMLRLTTNVASIAVELGAKLVGGDPHLLDYLGPALGEEGRQLLLGQRLAGSPALDRARSGTGIDDALLPAAGASARNEAPVLELDHV